MSDLAAQLDLQARELRDAKQTIRLLAGQVAELRALLAAAQPVDLKVAA